MALRSAKLLSTLAVTVSALRTSRRNEAGEVQDKDCYSKYDGKPFLQLEATSQAMRQQMRQKIEELECTSMDEGGAVVAAICDLDASIELHKVYEGKVELMTSDAGGHLRETSGTPVSYVARSRNLADDFYGNWRSYDDRLTRLAAAVNASGGAAKLETIGKSYEGRDIKAVRLTGAGYSPGKARVLVFFQQHAREWVTGMSGLFAAESACLRAKDDPQWLADTELVVVPLANPDGILFSETDDRMWRKNRRVNQGSSCRGVDLNRNYAKDWNGGEGTSSNKCSDQYLGTSAFSEPESQVLRDLMDAKPNSVVIDVHAFSQMILRPWGFTYDPHPRQAEIDVVGLAMKAAVEGSRGLTYRYGGAEIIYPASGDTADYATEMGAFGFCYELAPSSQWSGGFSPPTSEILPTAKECWAGIDAAISWAKNPTTPPPTPAPPPSTPAPSRRRGGWR